MAFVKSLNLPEEVKLSRSGTTISVSGSVREPAHSALLQALEVLPWVEAVDRSQWMDATQAEMEQIFQRRNGKFLPFASGEFLPSAASEGDFRAVAADLWRLNVLADLKGKFVSVTLCTIPLAGQKSEANREIDSRRMAIATEWLGRMGFPATQIAATQEELPYTEEDAGRRGLRMDILLMPKGEVIPLSEALSFRPQGRYVGMEAVGGEGGVSKTSRETTKQ